MGIAIIKENWFYPKPRDFKFKYMAIGSYGYLSHFSDMPVFDENLKRWKPYLDEDMKWLEKFRKGILSQITFSSGIRMTFIQFYWNVVDKHVLFCLDHTGQVIRVNKKKS